MALGSQAYCAVDRQRAQQHQKNGTEVGAGDIPRDLSQTRLVRTVCDRIFHDVQHAFLVSLLVLFGELVRTRLCLDLVEILEDLGRE